MVHPSTHYNKATGNLAFVYDWIGL